MSEIHLDFEGKKIILILHTCLVTKAILFFNKKEFLWLYQRRDQESRRIIGSWLIWQRCEIGLVGSELHMGLPTYPQFFENEMNIRCHPKAYRLQRNSI